jgi:tetratricopeptide (TPR) repeat protein
MTPLRHPARPSAGIAWAVLFGLWAMGVTAPAARADPARALKHFEIGKRYFQVEEYRKAIEEFKAAHVDEPDPAFLYNIADCHRRLGETKEALTFYRRYLSLSPPDAPHRAIAGKRIQEIEETADGKAAAPPAGPAAGAAGPAPASASTSAPASTTAPGASSPGISSLAAPPPSGPNAGAGAMLAPAPDAALTSTSGEAASPPFYRRAWFYVVLGVVVVAAAAGVWFAASSGGTDIPGTPLGNQPVFE